MSLSNNMAAMLYEAQLYKKINTQGQVSRAIHKCRISRSINAEECNRLIWEVMPTKSVSRGHLLVAHALKRYKMMLSSPDLPCETRPSKKQKKNMSWAKDLVSITIVDYDIVLGDDEQTERTEKRRAFNLIRQNERKNRNEYKTEC